MSAAAEAAYLLRRAAEPRPVGDSVKAAIRRAARKVGPSPSRAYELWYGRARRVDASEMDRLRAIEAERRALETARVEYRDLCDLETRIARVEAALLAQDPDFAGPHVDALRAARGGVDRAGDRG